MKPFTWSPEKNEKLKAERGISFEELVLQIEKGHLLDVLSNPKYPHQQLLIVERDGYAIVVPCVESESVRFLKTAFPSRKYTQKYLGESTDE